MKLNLHSLATKVQARILPTRNGNQVIRYNDDEGAVSTHGSYLQGMETECEAGGKEKERKKGTDPTYKEWKPFARSSLKHTAKNGARILPTRNGNASDTISRISSTVGARILPTRNGNQTLWRWGLWRQCGTDPTYKEWKQPRRY